MNIYSKSPYKSTNVILVLFVCLVINGCSKKSGLKTILDTEVDTYLSQYNPPGMAISVFKDQNELWSYAQGYADIEKKFPFGSEIIMNIGSVSKTITATAVLKLYETGKIDLNSNINDYLDFIVSNPNYPNKPITVKQLLTHTSSIKDGMAYFKSYACGKATLSLESWITNYFSPEGKYYDAKDNFHEWAPSEGYKYSNVAFGLLGLIVEKVSETSFDAYCEKQILKPLEMNHSAWFRKDLDTLQMAKQYIYANETNLEDEFFSKLIHVKRGDFYELCPYSFHNYPDGLFKTTLTDLSHFMLTIMNNGQYKNVQLLQPKTLLETFRLQVEGNDIQGLGWKKMNYESFSFWGHSGRDPGVRAHMYFNPDSGIGILLIQNNDEGNTLSLIEKIYTAILKSETIK